MYKIKHVLSVQQEDQRFNEPDSKTSEQRGGQMCCLGKSTPNHWFYLCVLLSGMHGMAGLIDFAHCLKST